jgi:hypothetical protein
MQRRHQSLLQQVAAATAAVREKRGIWAREIAAGEGQDWNGGCSIKPASLPTDGNSN